VAQPTAWAKFKSFCNKPNVKRVAVAAGLAVTVVSSVGYCNSNTQELSGSGGWSYGLMKNGLAAMGSYVQQLVSRYGPEKLKQFTGADGAAIEKECRDAVPIRIAIMHPNFTPEQSSVAIDLATERCMSKYYHFDYSFIDDMKIRIKNILHDEFGTPGWGNDIAWPNGKKLW